MPRDFLVLEQWVHISSGVWPTVQAGTAMAARYWVHVVVDTLPGWPEPRPADAL